MFLRYGELARKIAEKEGIEFYYKKMRYFFRMHSVSVGEEIDQERTRERFLKAIERFKAWGYEFYLYGYTWAKGKRLKSVLKELENAYIWEYMQERVKNSKKTEKNLKIDVK